MHEAHKRHEWKTMTPARGFAASPRQFGPRKLWINASERVQPAAAAATHQLVIRERTPTKTEQQVCLDRWRCVLCNDSCKVGLASARARQDPGRRARVHEEGALRPRLVPLRIDEGPVLGPVQELLVEQDAVGELHCGSAQTRLSRPENGD